MDAPNKMPLLGRLAVHYKLITLEQLREALDLEEEGNPKRLGEILVDKGWVPQAKLDQLLKIQRDLVTKQRAEQATEAVAEAVMEAEPAQTPEPANSEMSAVQAAMARARAKAKGAKKVEPESDDAPALAPEPTPAPAPEPAQQAPEPEVREAPAPTVSVSAPARDSSGMKAKLEALLQQGVSAQASDVHVHSGSALVMRRHGRMESAGSDVIEAADAEAMFHDALSPELWQQLQETGQVDFAYEIPGVARFRSNVYRQQRGMDGVFRLIPPKPPTLEELGLPSELAKYTGYHQGMVLITGPSGCGKSATMAAMLDIVNEERSEHILTVEDPIECIHKSKRCLVNQRQVGGHTGSFARALRAALREDPDIISIGELRDLETISLALTAAETGHFVLGTLHTESSIRTINRLIGIFPPNQQSQVRAMVSESLRAVISQRLVRTVDSNSRVPALEIMVINKAVGNLIREQKTVQLHSILQTGSSQGMCLLDDSLAALVRDGVVSEEEARRHCEDPKRFGGGAASSGAAPETEG